MKALPLLLTSLFLLHSCNESKLPKIGFQKDSCIKEISEKYRNISSLGNTIYKLENIEHQGLTISVWLQNEWYYQGIKPINFFADNKKFSFEETQCPDRSERDTSLKARLKSIGT